MGNKIYSVLLFNILNLVYTSIVNLSYYIENIGMMIAALYIKDLTWQDIYELRSLTGLDITKESISWGYDWVSKNEYKYFYTIIDPFIEFWMGKVVKVHSLEEFKAALPLLKP